MKGAMQPTDLRSHNLARVLTAIVRTPEPLSRAGIAAATGLTKPTISKLVETLIDENLIVEGPLQRTGGSGRPTTPLLPAPKTVCGLGIQVSADHAAILARDLAGETLFTHKEYGTNHGRPDHAAELVGQLISNAHNAVPEGCAIAGITIAVPGRMSADRTKVISSPGLDWADIDFASMVHTAAIRKVTAPAALPSPLLGNDTRLVARSELISRAEESFLLVHGETGIGGTIVLNGEILHGDLGWAGEIGHTTLDPHGPRCQCGRRGCLEAFASAWALREAAHVPEHVHIDELAHRIDGAVLEKAGLWLGVAISSALTLLDLQTVILSGYFGELFDAIETPVRRALDAHCLSAPSAPITLAKSAFAGDSALVGATQYALLPLLNDPVSWIERDRSGAVHTPLKRV